MVKYTRHHYVEIGNTLKSIPKTKRKTEYTKWNKIFKQDNPRYDSGKFKKHIGLK